jgi:hypothetical protein
MTKHKGHKAIIDMPSKEQLEEVALRPYSDEELEMTPELEKKIEGLMSFFDRAGISYDKYDPDSLPKLDFSGKKAYPNNDQYMHIPGQHDVDKWIYAVRTIQYLEARGTGRVQAIRQSTSGWNPIETFDFLNWLKFHESGDHMKYKFAQLWFEESPGKRVYQNGDPGYFLHIKPDPQTPEPRQDIDFAKSPSAYDVGADEKKSIIEKQRNKIIGRLDSAEKLMRSQEGQMFAGKEFETLLEAIYQLKKKIQLVNKVSASTRLYEDMIVREANILVRGGFTKAANVLFSVAQANNPPTADAGKKDGGATPSPTPPAPPAEGQGNAGGLPSTGPGAPTTPPDAPNENSPVQKFLTNLETGKVTTKEDKQGVDDDLEVSDTLDVELADDELLVTEAQVAPPGPPPPDAPAPPDAPVDVAPPDVAPPVVEEPLEVTEDDIAAPAEKTPQSTSDFDSRVNQVFSNITVTDVVAKLEDLAKVFKTREIPRQLGIIDMMLDSLGLASYFPSLSEATNKALESNNYISTRVEDILSKLRGSMGTKEIDLKGGDTPDRPEVAGIKQKLQSDEEKEKNRKQMRKDQETAELTGKTKETPEVEIAEDLGAPPAAPPAPAPAAPRPPV